MTSKMEKYPCPKCGTGLDAATDPTGQGHMPEPGDVTLCFYCECLLEFDDTYNFREINIQDLDQEVQDAIAIALAQIQKTKTNPRVH